MKITKNNDEITVDGLHRMVLWKDDQPAFTCSVFDGKNPVIPVKIKNFHMYHIGNSFRQKLKCSFKMLTYIWKNQKLKGIKY